MFFSAERKKIYLSGIYCSLLHDNVCSGDLFQHLSIQDFQAFSTFRAKSKIVFPYQQIADCSVHSFCSFYQPFLLYMVILSISSHQITLSNSDICSWFSHLAYSTSQSFSRARHSSWIWFCFMEQWINAFGVKILISFSHILNHGKHYLAKLFRLKPAASL